MKKQVILTVGAPGSGKSTWATEQAKNKKLKTIVLCRDDLRAMLFGGEYKYSRSNEAIVTTAVKQMLENALTDSVTDVVIIADTNLNEKTRKSYINICVVEQKDSTHEINVTEVPFDEPWHVLVSRNEKRGNKAVPKDVLRTMYKNMQKYMGKHKEYVADKSKPKAVIFDLDGTLADNNHRHAFDYAKLIDDKPIPHIVNLLKMYEQNGYEIICVSGRNAGDKEDPKKWHRLTKEWLDKHNIPWYTLIMRKADDFRKDDIVKEEIFWEKIANDYNVELAVDDRDQVVEMWRRIGVNCLQCDFGEF